MRYRFIVTFLLFVALPFFLVMSFIIYSYYHFLFDSKLNESKNVTSRYAEALEEECVRLSLKLSTLAFDQRFLKLAHRYKDSEDNATSHQISSEIDDILNSFFDYSDEIISVFIFLENNKRLIYKSPPVGNMDNMLNDYWYSYVLAQPEKVYFIDNLSYQKSTATQLYRLAGAIRPSDNYNSGINGILVLSQSITLNNLLRIKNNKSNYIIRGNKNKLLFSNGLKNNTLQLSKKNEFISYSVNINKTDWKLVNYMDISHIRKTIFNSFILLIILMLFISIMFFIYEYSTMKQIFIPIEETINRMTLLEKGDFSVRLRSSKIPEMDRMSSTFNNMVVEMQNLTNKIRRKEEEKKEVEIQALQFQINPHFLTNTLNTIKIMARLIDAETIRETTTALMRIVSNSFREPGKLNMLEKEIANIEDYIHIMKVRFGDTFFFEIRKDSNIENITIMKMLIQPIVENAIIHGLVPKGNQGVLLICFKEKNNKLVIDIIDTGVGISHFPKSQKKHQGLYNIGISNVRDRIRINYGDDYNLTYTGRLNFYTKATLLLPLNRNKND